MRFESDKEFRKAVASVIEGNPIRMIKLLKEAVENATGEPFNLRAAKDAMSYLRYGYESAEFTRLLKEASEAATLLDNFYESLNDETRRFIDNKLFPMGRDENGECNCGGFH